MGIFCNSYIFIFFQIPSLYLCLILTMPMKFPNVLCNAHSQGISFSMKMLFSVASIMVTITLTSVFAEFKEHVYKRTYATVKLTPRNELKIQWSLKNWEEKTDPEKLAKHWTMNESNENESWEMFKRANKLFKNSTALLSKNDETFSLIFLYIQRRICW